MTDINYNYLYVFDYSYPGIYEIKLTEKDQNLIIDEILNKYGLKESCCEYMCTECKLEIKTLNK